MKRIGLLTILAVLCVAQHSREDYRTAYNAWRQADPNLEKDAAGGGSSIAQRADRMAAEAAASASAREKFLNATAEDEAQQVSWLENAPVSPGSGVFTADSQFIVNETAGLNRTMDTFAKDPDPAIQQLRQAMARERAALEAVAPAIVQRKKAADAVLSTDAAVEKVRARALEHSRAVLASLKDAAAETSREAAAWAEYYRKIGEAAQGAATPITAVPPGVPPAVLNNPAPPPPTVTPLPLARYVGAWMFPPTNRLFHGPEPESIDLLVREENGHATGTLVARFKLPPGSKDDPTLRFDFLGTFERTRRQIFNLATPDGSKGTIELIPGPAFNLLEVNFQIDGKPGKIRQGDVVLVKK